MRHQRPFARLGVTLLLIASATLLVGANQHLQTTANPHTRDFEIRLTDEVLTVNLETPGTQIEKYSNGRIKSLKFHQVATHYRATFYPSSSGRREQVKTVRSFGIFDSKMKPDGKWCSFAENGEVLSVSGWHEGRLHGEQKVMSPHGVVLEEKYFDEGEPVGLWVTRYADGTASRKIQFPKPYVAEEEHCGSEPSTVLAGDHGSNAVETWYYPNGVKQKEIVLEIDAGCGDYVIAKSERQVMYHPNGKKHLERDVVRGSGTVTEYIRDHAIPHKKVSYMNSGKVAYTKYRQLEDGEL